LPIRTLLVGKGVCPQMASCEERSLVAKHIPDSAGIWGRYLMALDEVTDRMHRIGRALREAGVDYALVGGQAVALWVATKDPSAVRTTKDVDFLLRRQDLPAARAAASAIAFDYFEFMGVGMFLERSDPNPRKGVHLLWAGEKVRTENPLPAPNMEERELLEPGKPVVSSKLDTGASGST
jgi:hypothetical protein